MTTLKDKGSCTGSADHRVYLGVFRHSRKQWLVSYRDGARTHAVFRIMAFQNNSHTRARIPIVMHDGIITLYVRYVQVRKILIPMCKRGQDS